MSSIFYSVNFTIVNYAVDYMVTSAVLIGVELESSKLFSVERAQL
jgi:hypothetical protein